MALMMGASADAGRFFYEGPLNYDRDASGELDFIHADQMNQAKINFIVKCVLKQEKTGKPEAVYRAGIVYLEGQGDQAVDLLRARDCLVRASNAGHPKASVTLGDIYRKGYYWGQQAILPDAKAAASYYQRALNDPRAIHGLEKLTPQLRDQAAYKAQLAFAENYAGNNIAQATKVALQDPQALLPKDQIVFPEATISDSYALFRQAQALGLHANSVYPLGLKAVIQEAHPDAKYQMGKFCLRQKTRGEAEEWFRQAAEEGHLKAKVWLAMLDGMRSQQAYEYLAQAAHQGDIPKAKYLLAFRYLTHLYSSGGVRLIEEAAQQSYGPAQRWVRYFIFPQWMVKQTKRSLYGTAFFSTKDTTLREEKAKLTELFAPYPDLAYLTSLFHMIRDFRFLKDQIKEELCNAPTVREGLKRCFPETCYPGLLATYDRLVQQAQLGDEEADMIVSYFRCISAIPEVWKPGKLELEFLLTHSNQLTQRLMLDQPGTLVMLTIQIIQENKFSSQYSLKWLLDKVNQASDHIYLPFHAASVCYQAAVLHPQESEAYYEAAAQLGDSRALAALAYHALKKGDLQKGVEYYRQAFKACKTFGPELGYFLNIGQISNGSNELLDLHLSLSRQHKAEGIKVWQETIDNGYGGGFLSNSPIVSTLPHGGSGGNAKRLCWGTLPI